jgi:phosphomannomutase
VIGIGAEPNGVNINAGVGSTHIDNLAAKVRETRADLGIAFDGDGDRVLMADDQGNRSTAMTCCTSWPVPGRTKAACAARWSAR